MEHKRKLRFANGNSLLYGVNYGAYPKRMFYNFSSLGKMRPHCPLAILSSGIDCWHREVFRERIMSDTFSVEMVIDGVFKYTLDNKTYTVNPGEIFMVQLGLNSSMHCITETATKRVVIIEGPTLQHTLECLKLDRVAVITPVAPERLISIFDRLNELGKVSSFDNFRESCVECYHLLLELSAQNSATRRPPELQSALEYIHENLEKPLSLDALILHVQSSNATIHRMFRKYLNASPIEYYLNAKMDMAMGLLQTGELSVKEIASRLNYSSPQYFASEFKKRYGHTPSQIRATKLKDH